MADEDIPLRISWLVNGRRAHGYMVRDADALHLICLRDESETAAMAGKAAAGQLGLIGALVSAGVSAAREAARASDMRSAFLEQQHVPIASRVALHPLSRTIARAEISGCRVGPELFPTLVTSSGPLSITPEAANVRETLEAFCRDTQIPIEWVPASKSPVGKILLGFVLVPAALALVYAVICVPFAFRHRAATTRALEDVEDFERRAQPAAAAIQGSTGKPLEDACGALLRATPVEQQVAYVAALPSGAGEFTTRFPKYAAKEPPFSTYGEPRMAVRENGFGRAWAPSFGRSYVKMLESPFSWPSASSRTFLPDLHDAKLLLVAKVERLERTGSSARAVMAVRVLDFASGAQRCEGDLAIAAPPEGRSSSVGLDFSISQGLPLGLLLPACGARTTGICHDVTYHAGLTPEPPPVIAEATPPASSAKPAAVRKPKPKAKKRR